MLPKCEASVLGLYQSGFYFVPKLAIVSRQISNFKPPQRPATNFQLLATSYQLPTSSYQLRATSYQLPATNFQLPATSINFPLLSTSFIYQVTNYQLLTSQLPVTNFPCLNVSFQLLTPIAPKSEGGWVDPFGPLKQLASNAKPRLRATSTFSFVD